MSAAPSPDEFAAKLRADIAENRIKLPTLPEVALKVREAVESEDADVGLITELVGGDAAISARLIQVANSPLYGGRVAIENVQMAVTRMGLKLVKDLVVSLAMKQIFQASSEALDAAFRRVWEDSIEVAAISRVIAQNSADLTPEQAMLAGLVHNIGHLPVLTSLDSQIGFAADQRMVERYCNTLGPEIGCLILESWHFTEALVKVPCECVDLSRDSAQPDYIDIVQVARLEHLMAKGRSPEGGSLEFWYRIPAFAKVGMETEEIVMEQAGTAEKIAEVRGMLSA